MDNNGYLFYDSAYDALEKAIAQSGKPKKAIASIVYPGRQPETAKSLLSRALAPDNTDVRISIENLITILRETRANDFIFYLCDEFGFERPNRKLKKDFRNEIQLQISDISKKLEILVKQLPQLKDDDD
jgi:hypothetical protein